MTNSTTPTGEALKAQPVASDVEAIMVLVEAYARAVTLDERVTFEHMGMTAEETAEKAMNAAREALRTALSRALPVADEVRDAARYRWLRDHSTPAICAFYLSVGKAFEGVKFARETVDKAIDDQIDSAMAPKGETHE